MKWIIGIVLFIVIAAAGSVAAIGASQGQGEGGGFSFGQNKGPEGKIVIIDEASAGELVRTVSAPGGIEPEKAVSISAQVSARIVALPFEEGDEIREGDVVVRLDARDIEAQLDSARANVKSAEASLDGSRADFLRAKAAFDRSVRLLETGDISQSDMDLAEADFLQARSRRTQAEQQVEIAKAVIVQREKDLDNAIIRSPIDGIITTLNAEVGETVVVGTLNNAGSVIMEVADLSKMILKAQVDESSIAPVEVGQSATVYINAFDDVTYEGRVEKVGLKRQTGSDGVGFFLVEIGIETNADDKLFSGLSANTEIAVKTFSDVLIVPSQAVLERRVDELPREIRTGSPHVDLEKTFARVAYVVGEDNKTIATPVIVGASDLSDTVVLAGLEPGQKIVVGPYRELVNLRHGELVRDEAEVKAAEEAEEKAASESEASEGAESESETESDSGEDDASTDGDAA